MSPGGFFRKNVVAPVVALLVQGLSPEKIALTFAVGLCLAAFPVIGATTFLCTVAAMALKLNMPLIQTINYLGAPLQLGFLIPLIRLGERLFDAPRLRLSLSQIVTLVATEPRHAIALLWTSTIHAIAAWLLVAPLAGALVYGVLLPILRAAARRLRRPLPIEEAADVASAS